MSDTTPEPVDNGSMQADIAATNAAQAETSTEVQAEEAQDEEVSDEQNDTEDSAPSDGNDPPAKPKNKGVGKRIDELTRDKYDAIRERDYWREQAQRLTQPAQPQAQAAPEGKPTLEAFGYDQEAYTEALTDWKVRHHIDQLQRSHQQAQQQQKVAETVRTFQERVASVDADEWERAVAINPPTSPAMLEVIAESEVGPQIGIYLANNLAQAAAIAQMSPIAAARALGRIEAQLSAPVAPTPSPPKTLPKAPAPVSTLRPAAPIKKDLGDMDMNEYIAERNRQRKAAGLIP